MPGIQEDVVKFIQVQNDKDNVAILDWLTPIEYGPQHSDFLAKRTPETGNWFLGCNEYLTWRDSDKQTLFGPGIPGSGKTILTAVVIDDLITKFGNDPTIGIAFIYCNFRQGDGQKVVSLLASLLKQLARTQSFPESVTNLYNQHKEKRTRPSADDIAKTLKDVAAMYSKIFIVVDALDESQPSDGSVSKLLSYIFGLQANTATNFFATSRPIPGIEVQFKACLRRDILASEEDVRKYLDGHMSGLPTCVSGNLEIQDKIKTEIASAVEGMSETFLR